MLNNYYASKNDELRQNECNSLSYSSEGCNSCYQNMKKYAMFEMASILDLHIIRGHNISLGFLFRKRFRYWK